MNDHNTLHKPQYQEVLGLWQHDANKFAHKHEEWQYWCSHLISELDSLLKGKLNNYLIISDLMVIILQANRMIRLWTGGPWARLSTRCSPAGRHFLMKIPNG